LIVRTLEDTPTGATHSSTRDLAPKAGISPSLVGRIWRTFGLKPWLTDTFKLSEDPQFVDKVRDVVGLSSWPNLVQRWFAELTNKMLKRPWRDVWAPCLVVLLLSIAGCGGEQESDKIELLSTSQSLLDNLNLEIDREPQIIQSKATYYASATGLVSGPEGADTTIVAHMVDSGWSLIRSEPLDVRGTPASWGHEVVAQRDDDYALIALYDRIGARTPPPGQVWLQLSVSKENTTLAWAHPS
jgi:hypothetical protein